VRKDSILVETEIFNHHEVKPHFINACCFGWGFRARKDKDPFWIGVGHINSCDQLSPAQWMIFVECDYGLNVFKRLFYRPNEAALMGLKVRQVLESNSGIRVLPD
jgi:hypothetical protein